MIKLIRSKKLKRVKRVPKVNKFKFEDEQKTLNSKSNYIRICPVRWIPQGNQTRSFGWVDPQGCHCDRGIASCTVLRAEYGRSHGVSKSESSDLQCAEPDEDS